MRSKFCGKVGIITATLILLSMAGWSGPQRGKDTDHLVKGPFYVALGIDRVAIFPLSDQSHRESFAMALNWGGSERVVETIRGYLAAKGVMVQDQGGVCHELTSRGIINVMEDVDDPHSFTWSLVYKPHRPLMAETLMKSLLNRQGHTNRLSKEELIKIGRRLRVDTIIRGRIRERGREFVRSGLFEQSDDPLLGVAPFRLNEADPGAVGYALYKEYDAELPPVDTTRTVRLTRPLRPTAESSVLEIAIWLQNAKTGDVEWSGQIKLVCPLEYNGKAIETELEEGVKFLMDDFFDNYLFLYKGTWLCIREKEEEQK